MFQIINEGIKDLFSKIFSMIGGYYFLSMSQFILRKAVSFCCCIIIAIHIFIVGYYLLIPNLKQQELTLHFQKGINDSYIGYYFNQDHKDTLCNSLLQNNLNDEQNIHNDIYIQNNIPRQQSDFDHKIQLDKDTQIQQKRQLISEINTDFKTLCSIHIHNQRQELIFENESYQMNLHLILFDLKNKGFSQGIVPFEVTILDRNGDLLQIKKVLHFNQNQQKRNLIERLIHSLGSKALYTLGLQVDENLYEIDQILFEKLPNSLIDLQAIIIKIQDVGIYIQSSSLVINPILKHVRYYLHYYFYTTSVIITLAISIYLFFILQIYYCMKPCIKDLICKKRKQHFE